MSEIPGMNEEQRDELLEEYLRHIRGLGPEPDVSDLSAADVEDLRRSFAIVGALAGSLPGAPPVEKDPVAMRLGLVSLHSPEGSLELEAVDRPVASAVLDLQIRYPDLVEIEAASSERLAADSEEAAGLVFICRSLAERVLVIQHDLSGEQPGTREALEWFHHDLDATAVAFTSADAQDARLVTFPDCHRRLTPSVGWQDATHDSQLQPLGIVLGRYFDQSIVPWDDVDPLDSTDLIPRVSDDSTVVAAAHIAQVASSKPRLDHKRQARDYIANLPVEVVAQWMVEIYDGDMTGEILADAIQDYVRTDKP